MSYSTSVKDELSRVMPDECESQIAELAGILSFIGRVHISENDEYMLSISTEHAGTARKCFTLLKKTFNIKTSIAISKNSFLHRRHTYIVKLKSDEDTKRVLESTKLIDKYGRIGEDLTLQKNRVVSKDCCRRAFLRGAFLASGSVSDPEKAYHFEIVCPTKGRAMQIQHIMKELNMEAKIVMRKKSYIVYLKEGDFIGDALRTMSAANSLMEFENVRILKGMRNKVNRSVNCETANLNKTVNAYLKQKADIELIVKTIGLDALKPNLQEMAKVRLEYPDANLMILGNYLNPPVGKSGVNHRLRKLAEVADKLREEMDEEKRT